MILVCCIYSGALCCKLGTEFATYYSAVEQHPGEENKLVIDYTVFAFTLFPWKYPLCTVCPDHYFGKWALSLAVRTPAMRKFWNISHVTDTLKLSTHSQAKNIHYNYYVDELFSCLIVLIGKSTKTGFQDSYNYTFYILHVYCTFVTISCTSRTKHFEFKNKVETDLCLKSKKQDSYSSALATNMWLTTTVRAYVYHEQNITYKTSLRSTTIFNPYLGRQHNSYIQKSQSRE